MILGRFIGIDRFADPNVSDLAGCARDATALYAVFKDGLPAIDAQLIVNEAATIDVIRTVVRETLGAADAGDAVIISFATHGTRDHRIVACDSSLNDVAASMFALDDLVQAFRTSAADFVLVILDCCFGGAAPARVVAGTPASREIIDLGSLQGVGKLMLAASRMDEPAYEHPHRRHGLLTAALLDGVTSEHESVMTLVESVIAQVRADAAAIGVSQHPVANIYVDGGFRLPLLARGETFTSYFPEYGQIKTADVDGIASFGIPPEVVRTWSEDYGNHLHQLQLDAINEFRVLDGQSLLVVAPTSSGKTFIGELAAVKAILEGRRAAFLLPYKALVSEKYQDFLRKYGERLGLRVIRCNGDYRDQLSEFGTGKFDIALLTYEMFLGLIVSRPAILNLLGLVVLDEAQFIADVDRGINVELILTFLRLSRDRGISPQIVLLSAVLGGVETFAQWLNVRGLVSEARPVPLDFGVLDRSGTFEYRDDAGNVHIEQLLSRNTIQQRKLKGPSAQDVIVPLARQLLRNPQERLIIFRSRRGEAEGGTGYLSAELGLPPAEAALAALPAGDRSTSSNTLAIALRGGVAFHTSNLDAAERAVVERFYREPDGGIRVLTSTSGMAAGINTPASTVIIVETEQPKSGNPPMSAGFVRNMAGRAGRFGLQARGRAIILAENALERRRKFNTYVLAPAEPIRSTFSANSRDTWVLRLLRQIDRIPRTEVPALVVNTFGGYLAVRSNPNYGSTLQADVTRLLERMLALGLVEENGQGVKLTALGMACGTSSLAFESCLRLIDSARRIGQAVTDPSSLMVLLQVLEEGDAIHVPFQGRGTAEGRWQSPFEARFGRQLAAELTRFASDQQTIWRRQKRLLIAATWMDGVPIATIEQQFSVNFIFAVGAGDVRAIADATRFRLASVFDIVSAALPERAPAAEAVDAMLLQLEFGVPPGALFMAPLGTTLTRADMIVVANAGYTAIAEIAASTRDDLCRRLPIDIVDKLKRAPEDHP